MFISETFVHIDRLWYSGKKLEARFSAFKLIFSEIGDGFYYGLNAAFYLPVAIIKLPISFFSFFTDGDKSISGLIHKRLPGVTFIIMGVIKCILCFINIIIAPLLGFLSPVENQKYHKRCGLIKKIPSVSDKLPTKTFNDIKGMEETKNLLREKIINPLKGNKKLYELFKVGKPNGIIFHGPPGCGKTLFAEALAGELKYSFIKITPADVADPFIHGTVSKIKTIFTEVKQQAPCILFIDEFDSIGQKPISNSGNPTTEKAFNEEVAELRRQVEEAPKFDIIVIGATNSAEILDNALVRPGRFDTKIEIQLPDQTSRQQIFQAQLEEVPKKEIDYFKLAKFSEGFSCSDIISLVEDAKKSACSQITKALPKIDAEIKAEETAIIDTKFIIKEIKKWKTSEEKAKQRQSASKAAESMYA